MARTRSTIEDHPQREWIVDQLLAKTPLRKIAADANPPLNYMVLYRFAQHHIKPAIRKAGAVAKAVTDVLMPTVTEAVTSKGTADQQPLQPVKLPNNDVTERLVTAEVMTRAVLASDPVTSTPMASIILASREQRLKQLQDRHDRLQIVIDERAKDMESAPGGRSGLLCRKLKGKNADREEYAVDGTLLEELREHEKQVAVELGQWQEGSGPSVAIQIVCPVVSQSAPHPADGAAVIEISPAKR